MSRPLLLKFTSCQAESAEFIGRAVARYVGDQLAIATRFVDDVPWPQRERLLDEGAIHAGWICGLPYVVKADSLRPGMALLAAPVMAGARYGRRPVYFSDIVVRHDHAARTFADLRGARWAINEPRSHSGYNIVRYELARRGERAGFFRKVTETGAHQATLGMILDGEVDASAIDSTVLETELRRTPELKRRLRIVETWGPSPAPPWVVSRRLPVALQRELRLTILSMHRDPGGRAILRAAHMARFASVSDADYDPVRRMANIAGSAVL